MTESLEELYRIRKQLAVEDIISAARIVATRRHSDWSFEREYDRLQAALIAYDEVSDGSPSST